MQLFFKSKLLLLYVGSSLLGVLGITTPTLSAPKPLTPKTNLWGADDSKVSSTTESFTFESQGWTFQWDQALSQMRVLDTKSHKKLWESRPGRAFVMAQNADVSMSQWRGSFTWKQQQGLALCRNQTIDSMEWKEPQLTFAGALTGPHCNVRYHGAFTILSDKRVGLDVTVGDQGLPVGHQTKITEVFLNFSTQPQEKIFGFGSQFTYLDFKGRIIPVLSTEQGHLRGVQPYTFFLNRISPGAAGYWHTTYSSMAYFLTSDYRSLFLENTEMSFFDLTVADSIEIRLRSRNLRAQIVKAQTPLDAIEGYTEYAGRMPTPPRWLHEGAIVGKMGGSEKVRKLWQKLQDLGTPIAAFWLQDWVGLRITPFGTRLWWNWQLDHNLYPDWPHLVTDLKQKNIQVLGYVNPFLSDITGRRDSPRNLFAEAKALGYLVTKPDGTPYEIDSGGFTGTLVDLTHPAAFHWYKSVMKSELIGRGMKGWMADFGEALPFDAVTHSGLSGAALHNAYPVLWAKLNREVLEESGLIQDGTVFLRAGFTQSPRYAPMFWLGDQMTTWDQHDGIKSAVTGLLSSGLSGMSINHGDIGGLIAFRRKIVGIPLIDIYRTRELLLRWIELSAFTPFYRTHEGNSPEASIQIDSAPDLLEAFAKFAKIYKSIADYREILFKEASARGYPLVRHLWLHYPDDSEAAAIKDQWLLGPDILVAPILDPVTQRRRVYLPSGPWTHLWTGQTFDTQKFGPNPATGQWIEVAAPMGQPPVFYKPGSMVGERLTRTLQTQQQ